MGLEHALRPGPVEKKGDSTPFFRVYPGVYPKTLVIIKKVLTSFPPNAIIYANICSDTYVQLNIADYLKIVQAEHDP